MRENRVGSSAVERRYAKAEARVQFPAGALFFCSDNSDEQSGRRGDRRGFKSHSPHEGRGYCAVVAQRIKQSSRKRPIAGSIPARGSLEQSGA